MVRVRVFVDYWNFQITLERKESRQLGIADHRFYVNWRGLGAWLADKACQTIGVLDYSFDGVIIYASYNPKTDEGKRFHGWASGKLNRYPGVHVICKERRPKGLPRCTSCHKLITNCPHSDCKAPIVATEEKGIDTFIATDMIRLAWEGAYDFAVLASQDSDLVPAVEFLAQKGRKIIHAAFPPMGAELTTACWAFFDVYASREEIRRPYR